MCEMMCQDEVEGAEGEGEKAEGTETGKLASEPIYADFSPPFFLTQLRQNK